MVARSKRDRVVQDEVEKTNRRPADPTPLKPFFKSEHVRPKNAILASNAIFKSAYFRRKIAILAWKTLVKIPFFDAKMRFWPEKRSSELNIFDAKLRFWPEKPSSELHFSKQQCDSGLKNLPQNCVFSRKNAVLA